MLIARQNLQIGVGLAAFGSPPMACYPQNLLRVPHHSIDHLNCFACRCSEKRRANRRS